MNLSIIHSTQKLRHLFPLLHTLISLTVNTYLSTTRFIPHNQAIRQISAVEAMTAIDYPNLHFPSSLVKLPSGSPSGTRSSPPCILIHRYVFITKKLSCQLSSSLVSGNNPCFCKFYTYKLLAFVRKSYYCIVVCKVQTIFMEKYHNSEYE